jgi:hypothetical protein
VQVLGVDQVQVPFLCTPGSEQVRATIERDNITEALTVSEMTNHMFRIADNLGRMLELLYWQTLVVLVSVKYVLCHRPFATSNSSVVETGRQEG